MTNSADPDQKPNDLDLHCFKGRVYPRSTGQRLSLSLPDKASFRKTTDMSLIFQQKCILSYSLTLVLINPDMPCLWLQKPTDLALHCLQRQGICGFSRTRVYVCCLHIVPDNLSFVQSKGYLYISLHKKHIIWAEIWDNEPLNKCIQINLGPVVQSVVSLTSSLRVIWLTVFADSIYNILIFFAEKMWVAFALQKLLAFFQQKISAYLHITQCKI